MTISGGRANGANKDANGGAISSFFQAADPNFKPTLNINNVTFSDNQATLTSFSSGNAYDFGGGAIYSQGGFVNVTNSTFNNNRANNAAGGAIHILQSGLSISNSTFTGNNAIGNVPANGQGGAIYIDGVGGANGSAVITASRFDGNTTYNSGGAIYVNMYENSNQFRVDATTFSNNAVVGGTGALGGAISGGTSSRGTSTTGNASITISNSTFAGNSARRTMANKNCGGVTKMTEDGSGGALAFAQRARIAITNSTFSQNQARGICTNANGGALYVVNNSDQFVLTNNTFANNNAGWVGGAISNSQINGNPGGIVRNTIFWNNTANGIANFQQHCSSELDSVTSLQYPPRLTNSNFFNDVTCFKGKSAPSQTNLPDFRDAQLQALANNGGATQTMAILPTSPAYNGATANLCPATDQRGIARPQGAGCDIGAYERIASLSVTPSLIQAGSGDTVLSVSGDGFTNTSKVLWNGNARTTTFVNSTTLRVTIPAADLASVTTAQVSVDNVALPAVTVRVVANLSQVFVPLVVR